MSLSKNEVLQQSKNAFGQWEKTWRKHSEVNGKIFQTRGVPHKEIVFDGIGKKCVCIAYAPSFEDKIEVLKENQKSCVDILCVDKCLGKLVENDIYPKYVVIADAGIDYKTWCEPYIDKTENITLMANINANIEWTQNWKGPICFYVNKDNIQSEEIFSKISGCYDMIPAGSNVGNSVVIIASLLLRYDDIYLVGYDYCWGNEDNYYAFNDSDKRYYMKHLQMVDAIGRLVNTSGNLHFSARWLTDFYTNCVYYEGIKMYNCCGKGILSNIPYVDLGKKLKYAEYRKISDMERNKILLNKMDSISYPGFQIKDLKTQEEKNNVFDHCDNNDMLINDLTINVLSKQEALKWANR